MSTEKSPEALAALPPLALIAGPTASGKSDLAVRLALDLAGRGRRGVVINADSAQVYADIAILSARPTTDEMRGVEHRLFGTWDGATPCSAADWANAAKEAIAAVHASDGVPIVVGGTGLYIRTLLEGIAPIPSIDPDIRATVRAMSVDQAYAALRIADPVRAAMLPPADAARVARALEVIQSTGRGILAWQAEKTGGIADLVALYPAILLPARAWLYDRCDARFARMVERGACAEVSALLDRDLDPALPVMRAIGVPALAGYLRGDWSLDRAISQGQQATRHYVKRQDTWLKHQTPPSWPRSPSTNCGVNTLFERLLRI